MKDLGRGIALVFIFGVSILNALVAHADDSAVDLLDPSVPIVVHRKKTGVAFSHKIYSETSQEAAITFVPEDTMASSKHSSLIEAESNRDTISPIVLPKLPSCSENKVQRQVAGLIGGEIDIYDFVLYDGSSREQVNLAKSYQGLAVPYRGGKVVDNHDKTDSFLLLALTMDIRCLPTRFHFVKENRSRYMEHRIGQRAWDKDAPIK